MKNKAGALAPDISFTSLAASAGISRRTPIHATPAAPFDRSSGGAVERGTSLRADLPPSAAVVFRTAAEWVPVKPASRVAAAPSRAAVTAGARAEGQAGPQGLTADPAHNLFSSAGVDAVDPADIKAPFAVNASHSATITRKAASALSSALAAPKRAAKTTSPSALPTDRPSTETGRRELSTTAYGVTVKVVPSPAGEDRATDRRRGGTEGEGQGMATSTLLAQVQTHQLVGLDPERAGDRDQRLEGRAELAALDPADVVSVQAGLEAEPLLGVAALQAQPAHGGTERGEIALWRGEGFDHAQGRSQAAPIPSTSFAVSSYRVSSTRRATGETPQVALHQVSAPRQPDSTARLSPARGAVRVLLLRARSARSTSSARRGGGGAAPIAATADGDVATRTLAASRRIPFVATPAAPLDRPCGGVVGRGTSFEVVPGRADVDALHLTDMAAERPSFPVAASSHTRPLRTSAIASSLAVGAPRSSSAVAIDFAPGKENTK